MGGETARSRITAGTMPHSTSLGFVQQEVPPRPDDAEARATGSDIGAGRVRSGRRLPTALDIVVDNDG
jgi:hypothetical protein